VTNKLTEYAAIKCEYPDICSPEALVLAKLLKGESVKVVNASPDIREPMHDILERVRVRYGWPLDFYTPPFNGYCSPLNPGEVEFEIEDEVLMLTKHRSEMFISEVNKCRAGKCACAKKWKGVQT
jgi:hypothetical protein